MPHLVRGPSEAVTNSSGGGQRWATPPSAAACPNESAASPETLPPRPSVLQPVRPVGTRGTPSLLPLFLHVSFLGWLAVGCTGSWLQLDRSALLRSVTYTPRRPLQHPPRPSFSFFACRGCVQQSVRHRPLCPVCKAKVGRRDIDGDETMDRVVQVRIDGWCGLRGGLCWGLAGMKGCL